MRVAPDDDVYRVNAVWLGPRGLTFPWTARYLAYATWLVTFLVVLLVEAAVPGLHVGVPPVWEFSITTLFTYAVMSFVDHERPVRAVWQSFVADLGAPRPASGKSPTRLHAKVRVRARPRHDRRLTRAYFAGTTHTVPTHAQRYHSGHPGSPLLPKPPKPARGSRRRGAPEAVTAQPSGTQHADGVQPQPPTAEPARFGGHPGKKSRTAPQAPDRQGAPRQSPDRQGSPGRQGSLDRQASLDRPGAGRRGPQRQGRR